MVMNKSNKPPILMPSYNRFPVAFERGEGAYLYDAKGKVYLDFASGIAVTALGQRVVEGGFSALTGIEPDQILRSYEP